MRVVFTHLFYSKYLLWLRALSVKDRIWLLKVAIYYIVVKLLPKLFDLRDRTFPPVRKPLLLRLDRETTVVVWRDLTSLYALTEIYGIKDYGDLRGDEKVVIDLGANIGLYTIYAAKKTKGIVIAVEPEPTNFALLRINVKLNELNNVILINEAVGNYNGTVRLYLGSHSVGHSIFHSKDTGDFIKVKLTTLDSLLERLGIGNIDMVKIDVEKAEHLVLKGSLKTLSRCCRVVVAAEHDKQIKQWCIELLKSLEYKVVTKKDMIYGVACRRRIAHAHKI